MPQPFVNPYFFSQYQPAQYSPYAQRMENLQQFQQAIQPQAINQCVTTRIVTDFNTLTANDVPMNGGAFFVKADGSEIEQREWSASGQIVTKRYKAILDTLDNNPSILSSDEEKLKFTPFKEFLGAFEERLDTLDSKIDEILKQKTTSKAKKEVVADE